MNFKLPLYFDRVASTVPPDLLPSTLQNAHKRFENSTRSLRSIIRTCGARDSQRPRRTGQRRRDPQSHGRFERELLSTRRPDLCLTTRPVKFTPERQVFIEPHELYNNISFLGASPMFPDVACDRGLDRCIVTTGEGEINAASTSESP